MPYADLPGVRLYYEDRGQGDPVLLVHGGLGTGTFHWRQQIDVLAERYRVLAPDLRGVGRSSRVPFGPDVFHREAADLIALCDRLELPRVHLIAFSAGTMPARLMPIERPDLVATLTLISGPERLSGAVLASVRHLLAVEAREPKFAQILAKLHGEDYWDQMCTTRLGAEIEFAAGGGDPTNGRLAEIRCPVLLVRGENDHIGSRESTMALAAQFRRAEVEVRELIGGSHFVPQSAADWLNPILLDWLERHPLAPAPDPTLAWTPSD